MTRQHSRYLLRLLVCVVAIAGSAIVATGQVSGGGNIDPDGDGSAYAWGENIGWINFKPSEGPGVTVSSTGIVGYAWGENIGWINLSCENDSSCGFVDFGVLNDGMGTLSGYAWGENIGWINFRPTDGGVNIDPATGRFKGKAWGENIGWINFDLTDAAEASVVKTSWTPPFNTPAGTEVIVLPTPPGSNAAVTLTFASVIAPGQTTVTISQTGQPPSHGFKLGNPPLYFDISTTAQYSGPITICIDYSQIQFGPGTLGLFHLEGGAWANMTSSLDAAHHRICATVSSLSPFAIFEAYDADPPQLSLPASLTVETTGPTGALVTYSASAVDAVDGEVPVSCSPASGATFALGSTTVNCEATDRAGNKGTGSFVVVVRDTTPPSLVLNPTSMQVNLSTATATSMAVNLNGVATASDMCDLSVNVTNDAPAQFPIGKTTVWFTATDHAGNSTRKSMVVQVAYTFAGFFQPVDNSGSTAIVWNTLKAGQAVPIKWRLTAADSTSVSDLGSAVAIGSVPVACTAAPTDIVEETATTMTAGLKYDPAVPQFIYNWPSVKSWAGTCRRYVLQLRDGNTYTANFQFK